MPTPEPDTVELIDVCREVRDRVRHRVFVRSNGSRFVVMDGTWWLLPDPIHLTGALAPSPGCGSPRGLNGQWPMMYSLEDAERAIDVWRHPLEVRP